MPKGAAYIYNLNFFAGFLVASGTYWLLVRFSPIPAVSERWMEVGDEVRNPSLAYGAAFDEDGDAGSGSGEDYMKSGKVDEESGVRERKVSGVGDF